MKMFKVQMLNTIAAAGINQFPCELYELGTDISQPDAILVRSTNMLDMVLPPTVKVIGRAGAGVNNIPVVALTQRGIPVLNTPGANANAVRELVIAGMLIASRHLYPALNYVQALKSNATDINKQVEKDKKQFVGFELMGKTLGVIGLGSVGVKVANVAINLGMHVLGYDPGISVNRAWELSAEVEQAHCLEDLLKKADFISIHIPLMEETKNMIDHSRLQLMKNGVILLNFSREGVVDEKALETALSDKKVFSYVNDFPSVRLKNHPAVISLPHLGASTQEAEENCAVMVVKQMRDFLENGAISHSVNFPSVDMPKNKSAIRLSIINENVPNMVAQMSSKLAVAGFNIISLLNKSRNEVAYTLIDINGDVGEEVLKDLAEIKGVIQVRKI